MIAPLFAMPPPGYYIYLAIGLLVVFFIAAIFVTKTRVGDALGERNRRAMLGLAAILSGPLVGTSLAWIANALGNVYPADVKITYIGYTALGGIAGLMAGVVVGATGFFVPKDPRMKSKSGESIETTDDI